MSKKQHDKQVARARAQRKSKFDRRAARNKVVIVIMAVLMGLSLVAASLAALFSGNDQPVVDDDPFEDDAFEEQAEGPCPTAADQEVPPASDVQFDDPPRFDLDDDVTYVATIETTCGIIEVQLDTDGAPRTAENFLALADEGFYAGSPFHRTILGTMIQGGDPTGTGTGSPGYTLDDELDTAEDLESFDLDELEGLTDEQLAQFEGLVGYPRGTVAMANSGADTQGSQFFIVQGDPAPFFPEYTLIGQVLDGMDVVDDIAAGPAGGQNRDQALDPVFITNVSIDER